MLQELERKIQEQKRLANEIAKHQEELRRLQQNPKPNFAQRNAYSRSFSNNTGAIASPNGSHTNNNNRRNSVSNSASTINRHNFAANHFGPSFQGRNNFKNGDNLRQNSGGNFRKNNSDRKRVKLNANGNMFRNMNSQTKWSSQTSVNNNRQNNYMQVSNPQHNGFRNSLNVNGFNNLRNRNRFQNTPSKNVNNKPLVIRPVTSTNVLFQAKTINGDQNKHAVQGIPIPYNLHQVANNTENNWEKKSRTRNNKMQSNGSNTKQIVNVLNRVNEWNRNWQPQGTWQQNDKNGIKLSNSNSFQTFKQNNHTKNHHSQNTLKNAFEGSLAPAYNRAVGHEEISVFPQPEIRESLQVEDRPSNADSMTGALNSHKNSQKSISNHQNSYSGPTLWNGTTNITNNESGFNSNKPDTAIVIRYKDGKVQMGTDHFVKVETNNVAKETKSNSQTNKFGIAQKVNNAIQQPQHYSPFTIQQAATADNTEQMPFMLSRNSPAYLKNVGRTNNNRDSSLHHKSNSVPISISNRGQSQGAVNQQNHLRKVVMSTKDSGETHIPDRGRILFSQKHDTNIPNVKSQSHYPRNQIPSQGSSISEVPLSSQTQYGIENNYGTQQTIGKQKMPFHNVRLQQPQTISTNNGQDPSHFFSMQKKVGPQVVQVLPSGSHRNHQVQPQTNAQLLYSNYQKSHQPSRQQTVVSSQNGQEHSQWRQRGMGHMAAGGRISPAIVQTNPLSHDQLNQRSTGKQYRSPTNVQIPITVNRQPSVSKVSHGQYMSNEQQRLQDNLQLSVHAHNSNTDLHTRQKGALVAEAPMSVKMYSNDQDIHSTVTHTKTYSNDQPMHSVLAAQPPPLVQVVNTNGGVLSQTTKTNSHSSNDKSLGQMLTNQNNQNLQPSVSTDSGTQLHVPKNSVNTQVIQQTETLTANKSMHAESPSETKQILQTLLALLKGTNTQTTANVDLNNNAVAQPVKHVAPDNKVNGITPKQNPVVQTLQRGQDMRNVNVQNSANIPVITNPAYAQAIGNLNAVSGSNINVASHTNGHLSPAVPAFQSPFGPQMGHFGNGYPGMGNVGIGNMWGMGMQNPAAAQHMWQQLMFGGDNIDIPDPPDPPPTMMSSASTTYRAVSPPVTGTGIIGPLRLEFEGEAPFPHTTTTVATTTTTATTTTATTKTMKPKPKIKPKVVTKVKPKQIPKPDIINSIALKLAALLGKSNANGFSLGQNRLKAATKPKAKTKADGHAINNQAQTVNKIKAVPKQQSVISENAQINTNFAKSLKTSGDKVAHPQTLQLPVTFLSGKNPRQRKIAQELASTIDLNSFKPEVDPVLAGVDVKSVKAQQILAGPAIIKTDQINLKTLGTLEQFNSAHTYQPVVNVKPDSLNDITNVLTGKDTLDGIISAGASANTKSDQGAQVKIDKHHMITNIATNTVTTVSPTALNYANVAPAPSLEAEGLPKTNDGTLVIKTAVVDLLSQIKQLWMHADISTQQPTTTTTQVQ